MPRNDAPPRRRLITLTALVLLLVPAVAACGSDRASSPAGAERADADPGGVTIRLLAFRPDVVRVPAGSRLTWRQQDPGAHTVTSGVIEAQPGGVVTRPDGRFDSGQIVEGQSFSLALDQPGTYPYFCSIHPSTMRGELQIF
ncbi:MAG: plastocyanin/azurin family copper-binding protein [Actinomycetota bacterium]|nr:plastocyanin/azurin family copper-binding protein [Actinomycetota bacterium]